MVFNLAFCVFILVLVLLVSCLFLPIRLKLTESIIIYWIFWGALAVCAFFAEPNTSTDLYKHYQQIEQLTMGNWYADDALVTWRVLLSMVSCLGYKGFLPMLTILLFGYCGSEIMMVNKECFSNKKRNLAIYIFCVMGFCSLYSVISGVRNALAMALWSYAYSKYYEKKRVRYYIIAIVACLLHLAPMFPMVWVFLYEKFANVLKRGWKVVYVIITIFPFALNGIVELMSLVPIGVIQLLANRISLYQVGSFQYTDNRHILLLLELVLLFIIIWSIKDLLDSKYKDFMMLYIYSLFMFSMIYPIIAVRMNMIIGFLCPPIILAAEKKKPRLLIYALVFLCIFTNLYYVYSMIAHIEFNGIDFYRIIKGYL